MIVMGQWVQGIVLLVWGALVISSVDNVVRPKVMGQGEEGLPEVVTLISVLGGIRVFGFLGFIYGPLVVGLCLTAVQIYREQMTRMAGEERSD